METQVQAMDLNEHWSPNTTVSTAGTPACQVLERVWIGNVDNALDQQFLQEHGISHVLNATAEAPAAPCLEFHRWPLQDLPDQQLLRDEIDAACAFIRAGAESGGVLVHCAAGRSRASTALMCFLILQSEMTLHQAYQTVLAARPEALPNPGFMDQLFRLAAVEELWRKVAALPDVAAPDILRVTGQKLGMEEVLGGLRCGFPLESRRGKLMLISFLCDRGIPAPDPEAFLVVEKQERLQCGQCGRQFAAAVHARHERACLARAAKVTSLIAKDDV